MDTHALMLSLILTLVGMVVIFIFMGLLIIIVHFFISIASRFSKDEADGDGAPTGGAAPPKADSSEPVVAAIAGAIRQKQGEKT